MTIKEVVSELKNLQIKTTEAWGLLHLDNKNEEMKKLEALMSSPGFWLDAVQAGEITQKYDELKKELDFWLDLKKQTADLLEMAELDVKDKTVSLREDLEQQTIKLKEQFAEAEISLMFSGVHDNNNAFYLSMLVLGE